MKEIKKLTFNPKTLDNKMVVDSLEAVSQLEDTEPIYLVGGVGIQSYIPSSCRRPTSDVDYSIVRPLNYSDFKQITHPVTEFLQDNGYSVEPKKGSRACMLFVSEKSSSEGLAVEFSRRNEQSFNPRRERLERELQNSRIKILEGRKRSYRVASPEDLAVPKLVRLVNSLKRNPSFTSFFTGNLEPLSDSNIRKVLSKISSFREQAMISPADAPLAERLRVVSDLYDVRILAEIAGFNKDYFNSAKSDWDTTHFQSEEKDRVFNSIFSEHGLI